MDARFLSAGWCAFDGAACAARRLREEEGARDCSASGSLKGAGGVRISLQADLQDFLGEKLVQTLVQLSHRVLKLQLLRCLTLQENRRKSLKFQAVSLPDLCVPGNLRSLCWVCFASWLSAALWCDAAVAAAS